MFDASPAHCARACSLYPALAQTYTRSDIVRGLCQPDGCDEFTILRADRIAASDEGTLLKTRVRTFHASRAGRHERGEQDGYVFCSRFKPAVMAERAGRTMAFYLAPSATAESRERIRQNASFHALYFSLCHGTEAGQAAVHNLTGVARSLGYQVALAQSKLQPLARAEDILSSSSRQSADAGLDRGLEERPEQLVPPRAVPPSSSATVEARPVPQPIPPNPVQEEAGIMAAPRQLTNRMFDALDEVGDWVLGR
ncbi:hypothetical protein [Microvirga aerophila]|uniref:Uncharacterized protein n=1 Tax=Microvirga aerophila TaxID=670291 RepID=A0A512BW31_9HYPH|nr:hypothetical protein [Microvirga aerophila]GEO16150.1 hypothetical protein MAE02_38460 [Microvirga aerophila]